MGEVATLEATGAVHGGDFALESPPAALGRYEVVGTLGQGALGIVYRARDPFLDREVAIKSLHRDLASRTAGRRIRAEARALARLSHPNIVPIYDVGEREGRTFIVMERIAGRTLRRWLEGSPSPRQIVDLFIDAGRGLQAAHAVGLIHRDFKPENVLVDDEDRPRVADFGLVRGLDETDRPTDQSFDPESAADRLTRTGAVAGTPAYMAPEQFGIGEVSARSDQFAFCVALFEALTGARPFPGRSLGALVENTLNTNRATLGYGTGLRPRLLAVLRRGLAVRPEDRFSSMADLLDALQSTQRRTRARALLLPLALCGIWGALATPTTPTPAAPVVEQSTAASPTWSASEAQRGALATVQGAYDNADMAGAIDAATQIMHNAEAEESPQFLGRAQLLRARAHLASFALGAAKADAEATHALALQHDDLDLLTGSVVVQLAASEPGELPAEAERLVNGAAAMVARGRASPRAEAHLALARGMLLHHNGEALNALLVLERALQIASALDDWRLMALIHQRRGDALGKQRLPAEALVEFTKALDLQRHLGAHPDPLAVMSRRSYALSSTADHERAILQAEEALALARDRESLRGQEVMLLLDLARARYYQGAYDEGLKTLTEAKELGDDHPAVWDHFVERSLTIEVQLLTPLERIEQARQAQSKLLDLYVERYGAGSPLALTARLYLAQLETHVQHYDRASASFETVVRHPNSPPYVRLRAKQGVGIVEAYRGNCDEAIRVMKQCVNDVESIDGLGSASQFRLNLAKTLYQCGHAEDAKPHARRAYDDFVKLGPAWWKEIEHAAHVAKVIGVEVSAPT